MDSGSAMVAGSARVTDPGKGSATGGVTAMDWGRVRVTGSGRGSARVTDPGKDSATDEVTATDSGRVRVTGSGRGWAKGTWLVLRGSHPRLVKTSKIFVTST
jgi:hypothetical protein